MTDIRTRIAVRAYHAWEAAGRPDGQHEAHWLAAEAIELRAYNDADRQARRARKAAEHQAWKIAAAEEDAKLRRSAAAKRGAATRKANREALAALATRALSGPGRQPTAH